MQELIAELLKIKVKKSIELGERKDEASWVKRKGILLSRSEVEYIIQELTKK